MPGKRHVIISKISDLGLFLCIFVGGLFLSGCSLTPVKISDPIHTLEPIKAQDITVINLSPNRGNSETKVFTDDFLTMPSDFTNPMFPDLVKRRLDSSLTASGSGRDYRISLIRADLLVKSRVADSIPFVGFVALVRDRPHKCLVEALLETEGKSQRKTFESVRNLPNHWTDTSIEKREAFIKDCITDIGQQVRLSLVQLRP